MNNWIWALGFILQCTLLGVLLYRGMARRLPFFTALVAFYAFRTLFLFTASGHLNPAADLLSYNVRSAMDVALQILVAWELFHEGRGALIGGRLISRLGAFSALLALAATMTWAILRALPAQLGHPVDNRVLFPCLLMLMVASGVALRGGRRFTAARRVLAGFALISGVRLFAQVGTAVSGLHRNAHATTRWSYAEAVTYMAVTVFWGVFLWAARRRSAPLLLVTSYEWASSVPDDGVPLRYQSTRQIRHFR